MFKSFSNFFKSDNAKWIFVVIVVLILGYSLMNYSNAKGLVLDNMQTNMVEPSTKPTMNAGVEAAKPEDYNKPPTSVDSSVSGLADFQKVDSATPTDLLPSDKNSEFATLTPTNTGSADLPDMLQAGSLIGVDTIGQTLRNANLQVRSDPVIEKTNVGPWSNSTIEPNLSQVPFEIGCGKS